MTANDLRYNILLGVDSLYQGTAPGYNDKQMSAIINKAQRRVFRDKSKLFDTDEKIKRMLAPLLSRASVLKGTIVVTTEATIIDYSHSVVSSLSSTFYSLPTETGFIKEEYAILDSDLTGGETLTTPVIILPITYDYFTKNYKSRYKMPYSDLIWRMDAKLESTNPVVELIYPTTHTIKNYIVTYLRYPSDIVVDTVAPISETNCEIPDVSFQDEIIGEAVKIIVASLQDQDYQTVSIEKKFDEN